MPKWTKEQEQAIYLAGTNILVSAGAGSGKTAVLSERVLQKVLNGVDVDQLLVLTFTNAAALEMKERIRKKLLDHQLTEQVRKLDGAYIATFDAYALSIVKKYHHLLNIPKQISITDQSIIDIKKVELLDEVFETFYQCKDSQFLKFIDDFCSKDDREIKEAILLIHQKLEMKYDKKDYLETYLDNHYNDIFIESKINEYVDLLFDKIGLIHQELERLEEHVEYEYYDKLSILLEELFLADSYERIKDNLVSLPILPKNSEEEAKQGKQRITDHLKELKVLCIYDNIHDIKRSIIQTKEYSQIIIKIINQFDQLLQQYKDKNDLYEFIDIAKMAIRVVSDNDSIKKELKYHEILIDEYQDTNDIQEHFISLIENNNVYMVGDIKQSIYRFRNANPNLFKEKYEKYTEGKNGIKIDLNKNFRSRNEVLENINVIFDEVMDKMIGGADYKESHRMIFGNKMYLEEGKIEADSNMEIFQYPLSSEYSKEELEVFIIANDIKHKIETNYPVFDHNKLQNRAVTYQDFVILLDRTTQFEKYKKIFEYMGIPLTLYKDEEVSNHIDVLLMKNIIGFMIEQDQTVKKYCYLSILRSYLFSIDDEQIFNDLKQNDYQFLDKYLIPIKNKTPKELVEYIVDKFQFYQNIITVGDVEKHIIVLDYLIDLADTLTKMGYDIDDFYTYLKQVTNGKFSIKYPLDNREGNSVKIMTIHKSKGLEYPICYYGGFTSKFNMSDLKEKFTFDNNLGIITPIIDSGIRNTIYKDLLKHQYMKEEISEKIRLLYVALTRAKEKMIIVLPKEETNQEELTIDVKMGYRCFFDILTSIYPNIVKYLKDIDLEKLYITHDYNKVKTTNVKEKISLTNEKITTMDFSFNVETISTKKFSKEINEVYSKEEYENIAYGNYIHSIFEHINFEEPNLKQLEDVEKKLVETFLSYELAKDAIAVYQEYEFVDFAGELELHGTIDLLLEYENEFKIIDYKLKNIQDASYVKQLKGYKEYLQKLSDKKISTYLYSILDGELIEVKTD